MNSVYGVKLPYQFTRWMEAFKLDLFEFGYPSACVGSMNRRLITSALWPVVVMLILTAAIAVYIAVIPA